MQPLFPLAEYWWLYLAFTGLVILLLAVDLTLHREDNEVTMREATSWTAVWIGLALAFCYAFYHFASARFAPEVGRRLTMEFLAGYIVEKSLSVDNMFVFALVFRYFAVPARYQHRVLFYGVLGAMVFRGIFVGLGAALVRFEWVLIVFGLFLIYSGARLAFEKEKRVEPGESLVVRTVCRFMPVTPELRGSHFFARVDGVRHATPLLIALLFLESTDVLFAVDSVPAVFGVTREPFVVYSSNIFAILGLRSMFFLLAGALERFHILKHGLAVVLIFVGLKMVWLDRLFEGRFPISASLAIIVAVIGGSIALSLLFPKPVEVTPARHRIPLGRAMALFWGSACLVLAGAAVFHASAPAEWLPLPALGHISAAALYVSAACYAVVGTLLLGAYGRQR